MDDETVTEWKVTWFPLSGPPWQCQTKTVDETKAKATFQTQREAGTHPILESRRVIFGSWVVIDSGQPA